MKRQLTLEDLAEYLVFGLIKTRTELHLRIEGQWEYLEGKSFEDIQLAIAEGLKVGKGFTYKKVKAVECSLKDILIQVGPRRK